MTFGIRLHVWGERACFTRPENKVERVSYDVMTPSAARGILEAIYWKPAIRWVVTRIHVLRPVRFESIRRNEVGHAISDSKVHQAMKKGDTSRLAIVVDDPGERVQRAATILKDVAYVIEAHFEMTGKGGPNDTAAKHLDCFNRRARKGQCFHRPCLGTREFAAHFELVEGTVPAADESLKGERDLGLMLHDIEFTNGKKAHPFQVVMHDGMIEVPSFRLATGGAA